MQKALGAVLLFLPALSWGQISLSRGVYVEDFDALVSSGSAGWEDNLTLRGWYASRGAGSDTVTNYAAGAGTGTTGDLYSFGAPDSNERALGSLASGGTGRIAYGVRLVNDTDHACTGLVVSYTGEQWRVADSNAQSLRFFFQIGSDLTNADAANDLDWTPEPALDFVGPQAGATSALNGNAPANQHRFDAVPLQGVVVPPGMELFLRWVDENDAGYDDGLAIDDFELAFAPADGEPGGPPGQGNVSLLTYNTHGNQVEDWSTNSYQVRAIGRQLAYLHPDLITLNEIPETNTWQIDNWVKAFVPGYFFATNSIGDGSIRNVILSRFPITRSQSWLHGSDLAAFGFTNSFFKRDLFEAEIAVPQFDRPLHVFVVHLKSGQDTAESKERGAEAGAISNFFAVDFPALYSWDPYTLSGDMNEDIARPPSSFPQSVARLVSGQTGLQLMTPLDPVTQTELTFSIQSSNLTKRYDYILPCGLLRASVTESFVFRTDEHPDAYPLLHTNDSRNASDHLPVILVFRNPYDQPFRILSPTRDSNLWEVRWESIPGQSYCVQRSSNLVQWADVSPVITATGYSASLGIQDTGSQFLRVRRLP